MTLIMFPTQPYRWQDCRECFLSKKMILKRIQAFVMIINEEDDDDDDETTLQVRNPSRSLGLQQTEAMWRVGAMQGSLRMSLAARISLWLLVFGVES